MQSPVPTELRRKWQADVGGLLTAPTISDGKVFVASMDRHAVSAIDADSGQTIWKFTAGGRVDSSPTLDRDRALFGCRDGHVYSVRISDGALAWRLQAASSEQRIVANGQLESVSPVHGSVLVQDQVAFVTSGRSSYLDGGISLHRVETASGKLLSTTPIYSPDPETGRQPPHSAPATMPGARSDILTSDGSHIYLRDMVFSPGGEIRPEGDAHLFTLTGFLDDAWAHRSYWIFGKHCSISTGCSGRDRDLVYGRLLVFDDATIYGFGRRTVHWSNQLQDGPYRLFAMPRDGQTATWETTLPIQVRAMLLADKTLLAAGTPVYTGPPIGTSAGDQSGMLLAISATDGTVLTQRSLAGRPVFDGMAANHGRLYISLENGRIVGF